MPSQQKFLAPSAALVRVGLLGALLTACLSAPTQGQSTESVTAFVNVSVIPMNQEQTLADQTVLVQGARIIKLGPSQNVRVPAGAVQIDGHGKYLIPGLTDMHIHLGANGGDSATAERALFLLLAHGITTARNMDYRPKGMGQMGLEGAFLLRLRTRTATGELPGPRLYTSDAWGPPQYIDASVGQEGNPSPRLDSVAAYVAAYKAAGYDFVKIHDENQTMAESVIVAARRVGIPVAGHVVDSLKQALSGYHSIEHLTGYRGDSAEVPAATRETKRAGVWNCPTLVTSGDPSAVVKALQSAGAGLLSGTDACASFALQTPGSSLHEELEALANAGLTPYQVLLTSTRNVAEYFGTLSESGTIEEGKQADMVLLEGNPLTAIKNTKQIAGVMRNGHWFSQAALDSIATEHHYKSGDP